MKPHLNNILALDGFTPWFRVMLQTSVLWALQDTEEPWAQSQNSDSEKELLQDSTSYFQALEAINFFILINNIVVSIPWGKNLA